MQDSLWTTFLSTWNSSRFTPFFRGVPVSLPNGTRIVVRAKKTYRAERPPGLRFSPYSFVTEAGTENGDFSAFGFGEAGTELLALQKSISEAVERTIYYALKGTEFGTENSNGWACHLSEERARYSAQSELLERDAVLVHWLSQTPMREVSLSQSPQWLQDFSEQALKSAQRFQNLRVLVSHLGFSPSVTTVLTDADGYAVLSHSSGPTLPSATIRALAETCRIAQIALETPKSSDFPLADRHADSLARSRTTPEDHALAYAQHWKFPTWIFGKDHSWRAMEADWKARSQVRSPGLPFDFQAVPCGSLVVVRCRSACVQSLFFGKTEEAAARGLLNLPRLKQITGRTDYYPLPHCVP